MAYPRFEQAVRERVVDSAFQEVTQPGYGIVLHYNKHDNTATVLMSRPGSDQTGQIYQGVPCPVQGGVQTVAPEPGRPCWVVFAGAGLGNPMITHYFNPFHDEVDYSRQYQAYNPTPQFIQEI